MTRRQQLIVGLFIFACIGGLMYLTYVSDDERALFGRKPFRQYRARFASIQGLRERDPVYLLGLKVGRIERAVLVKDEAAGGELVEVVFVVEADRQLREDATARIQMSSLMGGRLLAISPGTPGKPPLSEGSLLATADTVDIDSLIASATQALSAVGDAVAEVRPALAQTMQNIERITGGVDAQKVQEIVEDVRRLVGNFREISEKMSTGEGTIARLINDAELSQNVKDAFGDLAASVREVLEIVSDVGEGKGTIGTLLKDPETAENVKQVIKSARDVMVSVSESHGTLGKIINEPEVYESLKAVMDDVTKVTAALSSDKGTLGAIINNPELYLELKRLLVEAREAVEDAREQAPLMAFGSVLFGFIQ